MYVDIAIEYKYRYGTENMNKLTGSQIWLREKEVGNAYMRLLQVHFALEFNGKRKVILYYSSSYKSNTLTVRQFWFILKYSCIANCCAGFRVIVLVYVSDTE